MRKLSKFTWTCTLSLSNNSFLLMKISIITVAYNSASTIRDTIESVLAQTYQNIEYILVDGDSYDNTLEIIKEYEPMFGGRIRWVSAKDKGIYDAMNNGLAIVTGDVVAILNSDDVYCDTCALEKVVSVFNKMKSLNRYMQIWCMYHMTIHRELCDDGLQGFKDHSKPAGIRRIQPCTSSGSYLPNTEIIILS